MIDFPPRPMVESSSGDRKRPDGDRETWSCSRCRNTIAQGVLVVGSYVQIRCHHSIRLPSGERKTCGFVNRFWPTR